MRPVRQREKKSAVPRFGAPGRRRVARVSSATRGVVNCARAPNDAESERASQRLLVRRFRAFVCVASYAGVSDIILV